jgi:hypothetical protein
MPKYSIVSSWDFFDKARWRVLEAASDEQLEKWINDPDCQEQHLATAEFKARRERRGGGGMMVIGSQGASTQAIPFDPRTEISADAKHIAGRIVSNLWVIFVLLPIVLGILFAILK